MCKLALTVGLLAAASAGAQLPTWVQQIRSDHPRLFFNRDTWPAVRDRALGEEKAWYEAYRRRVDALAKELAGQPEGPRELGPQAAWAAFVYQVTGEAPYLDLARRCLRASIAFYEDCYRRRVAVNWYSTTRVHYVLAWDWLYDDLPAEERSALMERLVDNLQAVITARPAIYRENISGYTTGFYGVKNTLWFVGCTAHGTGLREALVNQWLVWGHDENLKLLAHRREACGDDGGSASPTLGYAFGAYPWAEQNWFYTWLSATGENLAPQWPHSAWFANYVMWNWIPGPDGRPREFGYGDTPHTENLLPTYGLYSHMANIRHLFGRQAPEAAALARWIQEQVPNQGYGGEWFIYPFLLTDAAGSPPPLAPDDLPPARHFDRMGQVYMRSGTSPTDTYGLFTCGGILGQHRHFDALNVVIYKGGHQALDTGTRWEEFKNGKHLAQYFAQSVAHNVVLIHQPQEPTATYWGWPPDATDKQTDYPCYGGQNKGLGSVLKAFETNPRFTYVAGDATACYRPEKAKLVTRQMVFVMPNVFVICDRVTSADPTFRKDWLLHPAGEPRIDGATVRSEAGKGRLFCRTLLPRQARLRVVGGPGHEFRTGERNWDIFTGDPSGPERARLSPAQLQMIGQWRVEVTPPTAQAEDVFLHVIEVGDATLDQMLDTELIEAPGQVGVRFTAGGNPWSVRFATTGDLAGWIGDQPLTTSVQAQAGILAR